MNDITVVNDEPCISSIVLAKRLGVKPRHTFRLIRKYNSEMNDLGVLRFENAKGVNGRPQRYALLNEDQSVFVLTLSKNTRSVVKLKKDLSGQFVSYRKLVIQKQQIRLNGKKRRRDLTDAIKNLAALAKESGSRNSQKYYTSFTKLIYKMVFDVEKAPENFRDSLDEIALCKLQYFESQISLWLIDALKNCSDYHEPYYVVKQKLKTLVDALSQTTPMALLTK